MYILSSVFLLFCLTACTQEPNKNSKQVQAPAYTTIPGVTAEEIEAVEAVLQKYDTFNFGFLLSTDSFIDEHGEIAGTAQLFSNYLKTLFGVELETNIYEWDELLQGLYAKEIHFTLELTPTEQRQKKLNMTSAISQRSVSQYGLTQGAPAQRQGLPRYGFLVESSVYSLVSNNKDYDFEAVFYTKQCDAAKALQDGEIDLYFDDSTTDAFFEYYKDIEGEVCFPLIFESVSLCSATPDMAPIITVMQRFLDSVDHLSYRELSQAGLSAYKHYRFSTLLDEEEKKYLDNLISQGPVAFAAETDNYPISFYNQNAGQWQGIAVDILDEISQISGLEFEIVTEQGMFFNDVLDMLDDGKADIVSELIYTPARNENYTWTQSPYKSDNYAMLSLASADETDLTQIYYRRVGFVGGTSYEQVFHKWFPNHKMLTAYNGAAECFDALENGDIDLFMVSSHMLLNAVNYLENPVFKTNILLEEEYYSYFGFRKDSEMLASIISKAQSIIDTEAISGTWERRVFDYHSRLSEQTVAVLGGLFLLIGTALILVLQLAYNNRQFSRNLEKTVQLRTAELATQTDAAVIASLHKSEFLTKMSHEIRTPLNAVTGMAHVAKYSTNVEKIKNATEQIISSSSHLLGILNDILDMSKIEEGSFQIENHPFALKEAVLTVVQIFEQRCLGTNIVFESNVNSLEEQFVNSDKLRIAQILINLLGNAFKFTNNYMRLEVKLLNSSETRSTYYFEVLDNGIGLSEQQKEKLFLPFEQSDAGISNHLGGTGLGLPISQNLVMQLGGKIEVESQPQQGARFFFTLCFENAPAEQATNMFLLEAVPNFKGKRALLVEDIEINRIIFKELLADSGLIIDEAENGFQALALFSEKPEFYYDLIVMDIQMPEMDGYEACAAIRTLERCDAAAVPVVALTANVFNEDVEKAFNCGMNAHLAKPIDIDEMYKLFIKYLL